jgi:hypothetical protein
MQAAHEQGGTGSAGGTGRASGTNDIVFPPFARSELILGGQKKR